MKNLIKYISVILLSVITACSSDSEDEVEVLATSIKLSTERISFSDTDINNTSTLTFNITNSGDTDISRATISNTNSVFEVSPSSFVIKQNETQSFTISFTPFQEQAYNDELIIKQENNVLGTIEVNGTGIVSTPVTSMSSNSSSLDFENVVVNENKELVFSVMNNGNQNIQNILVTNSNSEFIVSPNNFSLNVNSSKTIKVTFTPTQVQNYSDAIQFSANNETLLNIVVSGSGVEDVPTLYTNHIQPIMSKYCTSCHGSSGGISLETYTLAKNAFQNNGALQEIESGRMPQGSNKVTQAEIDTIKDWISNGYQQ